MTPVESFYRTFEKLAGQPPRDWETVKAEAADAARRDPLVLMLAALASSWRGGAPANPDGGNLP